jgi:kumamolisin
MAEERKVFQDSVIPLPDRPGIVQHGMIVNAAVPQGDEKMTILFSLSIPAQTELEERVAKGEIIPFDELSEKYAPNPEDVKALTSWLQKQGFQIEQTSQDGTSIYAQASVDQITKSLAVKMVRVTREGITYSAASNAPSLPADVGRGVHAIIGLQPFRKAHKHSRMMAPKNGNRRSLGDDTTEDNDEGVHGLTSHAAHASSPNIVNAPPFLVQEVLKAYNADELNVSGKGQTIAILIDTFPRDADLKTFWRRNNLPVTLQQVEKINVSGGHLPVPEGEETLDTEWTSGVAPGAKVRIYASGSLEFVALDRALDRILEDAPSQPGMRQLSVSLGLGELFLGGPQGEVATQHQKFLRLAAAGVNVFVSSGDAGSNPDGTGHGAGGSLQAEYASSDSSVVGVGGTTLRLAVNGTVADESGWVGSGGGKSIFFQRPAWQTGPGVFPGTERLVPDVSLAADPNEGAFIVFQGRVMQIGGTSWSAPVWAGLCALINEARTNGGMQALPFLNPLIYPLLGTSCFRDVIQGSNGEFHAGSGHDLVTGIGVPNVEELIRALTAAPPTA